PKSIDKDLLNKIQLLALKKLTNLQRIVLFLKEKTKHLVEKNKLSKDEEKVIQEYYIYISSSSLSNNMKFRLINNLKLAIYALEDKKVAETICNKTGKQLDDDIDDRWGGWFKSAIVDSLLAYRRDRGDNSFPTTPQELIKDRSCFAGSLNRIINSLNLIHPDVLIQEGLHALENMETYREKRNVAKIKNFGQDEQFLQKIAGDYSKNYLKGLSVEKLDEILAYIDEPNRLFECEPLEKLQKDLKKHIIDKAKSTLSDIKDDDLIEKELRPFITAYIEYSLDDKIKDIANSFIVPLNRIDEIDDHKHKLNGKKLN
ncbi:MAG: hypothetical protein ACR2HS_01320, partial [Gammaproteobacteria bacterium]